MVFAVCVVVVVTAFGVTLEYGVDAEIMMIMLGGRVEVMFFVGIEVLAGLSVSLVVHLTEVAAEDPAVIVSVTSAMTEGTNAAKR